MDIVEIEVNTCNITSPNCIKFGIKSGKNIPVITIQNFQEALIECKLSAIA